MTNQKIISILQEDLERKCNAIDISILSYPDDFTKTILYMVVDTITGCKEFLKTNMTDDDIHKVREIYDQLIACAQRLVNSRYNNEEI